MSAYDPGWERTTVTGGKDIRRLYLEGTPRAELWQIPPDLGRPELLQVTVLSRWAGIRKAVAWFPLGQELEAQEWAEQQLRLIEGDET